MSRTISVISHLNERYDGKPPRLRFQAETVEAWQAWRQELRDELWSLLGLDCLEKEEAGLERTVEVIDRFEAEHYTGEKILLQVQQGLWMPAWVLVPRGGTAPHPALMCLHGHGMSKDILIGRPVLETERVTMQRLNGDYGRQFAERGYVCFCPDARGFGDRRGEMVDEDCSFLFRNAILVGQVLAGLRIWDHMRGLDYLASRPDVDASRIGAVGLSMGCEHVMYLSALDERIQAAVLSCCMRYLTEEFKRRQFCLCAYVPNLLSIADWPDIGALIAPRPVLIDQGEYDIIPMPLVYAAEKTMNAAYTVANVPERIETHYFQGMHEFGGRKVFAWVDRWVKDKGQVG